MRAATRSLRLTGKESRAACCVCHIGNGCNSLVKLLHEDLRVEQGAARGVGDAVTPLKARRPPAAATATAAPAATARATPAATAVGRLHCSRRLRVREAAVCFARSAR